MCLPPVVEHILRCPHKLYPSKLTNKSLPLLVGSKFDDVACQIDPVDTATVNRTYRPTCDLWSGSGGKDDRKLQRYMANLFLGSVWHV